MNGKFILISCLIALVLVASPASAAFEKYSLDVNHLEGVQVIEIEGTALDFNPYEQGRCIVQARFIVPAGSQADFILYDNNQQIAGHLNVSDVESSRLFGWSLGDESFLESRLIYLNRVDGDYWLRSYTDSVYNGTTTETLYVGLQEYFRGPTGIAYADLNAVAYRITLTATEPVKLTVWTVTPETIYSAKKRQIETPIYVLIQSVTAFLEGTAFTIAFAWALFTKLFVQNLGGLVALYVTITAAVSVCTSRDIFKALETWIGYQVSLINFMLSMLNFIIGIVTKIIDALKPL